MSTSLISLRARVVVERKRHELDLLLGLEARLDGHVQDGLPLPQQRQNALVDGEQLRHGVARVHALLDATDAHVTHVAT